MSPPANKDANPKARSMRFLGYGYLCPYQTQTVLNLAAQGTVSGLYVEPAAALKRFEPPEELYRMIRVVRDPLGLRGRGGARLLLKPLEYLAILALGLREILKGRDSTMLITGWPFFLLIPVARLRFKKVLVLKFGIAEELLMARTGDKGLYYLLVKALEKLFFPLAHGFAVVSGPMAEYVARAAGREKEYCIVPCAASQERFGWRPEEAGAMRERLGLGSRLVAVHLGSLNPWQDVDELLEIFRVIKDAREDALLLLVTKDPGSFEPHLARHGIGDYKIVSAAHDEVPGLLWGSDVALLPRKSHIVVEVSSPMKYAEYVMAGLPVLISPKVGEFSQLTAKNELGLVVDLSKEGWREDLARYAKELPLDAKERRRISSFSGGRLSWESLARVLRSMF